MYYAINYSGGRAKNIDGFKTEAEIDTFAKAETSYDAETIAEEPEHFANYDPPMVFAVIADSIDFIEDNKVVAPYAVYVRGQKWLCLLPEGETAAPMWKREL